MNPSDQERSTLGVILGAIFKATWFMLRLVCASFNVCIVLLFLLFGFTQLAYGTWLSTVIGALLVLAGLWWLWVKRKTIREDYELFGLKCRLRHHGKNYSKEVLGEGSHIFVRRKQVKGENVPGVYEVTFKASPGYTDAHVHTYLDVLRANMGVNVYPLPDTDQKDGTVQCVLITRDLISEKLPVEATPALREEEIAFDEPCEFGLQKNGEPVAIPLYTKGQGGIRMTVAGRSGAGKNSPVTQLVLHAIAAKFDLYLCDPKQTELTYAKAASKMYATEVVDMLEVLGEVNALMTKRQKIVAESGYNTWNTEIHGAPVLLVIDEITTLTTPAGGLTKTQVSEAGSLIVNLAARARSAGISLILVTQQLSTDAIPTAARSNFDIRLSMSVPTNTDAEMAIPGSMSGDPEYNPANIGGTYDRNGNLTTAGVFVIGGLFQAKGRSYFVPSQRAKERVEELVTKYSDDPGWGDYVPEYPNKDF